MKKGDRFKAFVTKYALTQGIAKIEAEYLDLDMIRMINPTNIWNTYYHGEGREWHKTKEGAIIKAEEMREKKIKSLEKQLEKLKNMKFDNIG